MKEEDLILGPIYAILILWLALVYRHNMENELHKKNPFYVLGILAKMGGAVVAGLLYQFFYEGGDTFNFYKISTAYWNFLFDLSLDLERLWILITMESGDLTSYQDLAIERARGQFYSWYFLEESAFFVGKIAAAVGYICFNSYTVIALIFAFICFTGMWRLYTTMLDKTPEASWMLAGAILFLPSTIFWGSGLFKDTITLGCLGYLVWCADQILIKKNYKIGNFIYLAIAMYVTYKVKAYILACFIPAAAIWYLFHMRAQFKNQSLFSVLVPLLLIVSLGGMVLVIQNTGLQDSKYSIDNAISTIETAQVWHTQISASNRSYTVGEYDKSIFGILSTMPVSISFALFRPFLWEADGIVLLASMESTVTLIVTVVFLLTVKWKVIYRTIIDNPILLFCFTFAFSLGFIVGLSSYNFGALSRYRMPILPIYLSGLILFYYKIKEDRSKKRVSLPDSILTRHTPKNNGDQSIEETSLA